jgi:hypothetical protein
MFNNNENNVSVDDVIVQTVANFIQTTSNWTGTMTQLSRKIARVAGKGNRNYLPGSPSALRKVIDRNIRRIRSRGVSVRFSRASDRTRTRFVTLVSK